MSSVSDENVESKSHSETQIMSNLLIVLHPSNSPTYSKLYADRKVGTRTSFIRP